MQKATDFKNIACVLPRWERMRIISEIIFLDAVSKLAPVKPETVVRWIADSYCIDFDRAKRRSEAECCMGKGAPIPIGPRNVFLPFHLVDEGRQEHGNAYAFCNVAIQELEIRPDEAHGGKCSWLRLGEGTELLTDWSTVTMRHHLALAVDAHQRLLRNTLKEMPLFPLTTPVGIAVAPH